MRRKSQTQQLTDTIAGQHLALSVAAHLARTQLVRDPLTVYDGQHILEMINAVGGALARVARLYALDTETGLPRELLEAEVLGATVQRGASVLVLKDGRTLSGVSIKRSDLREAITILKAVGIPELGTATPQAAPASEPKALPPVRVETLRSQLAEIEELLRSPLLRSQVERANQLALSIARNAPHGRVANLAMHLMSAVHDALRTGDEQDIQMMLARLSAALDEAKT